MKLLVHKDSQDSEKKEQLQLRSDEGQEIAKGERKLKPRSLSAPTITSKRQYAHPIDSEKENWDPVKLMYVRDLKRTKKSTLIRKPLADITALYQSTRKINGEAGLRASERSKQVLAAEKDAIRSKSAKNQAAPLIDTSVKTTEKYSAVVSISKPNADKVANKTSAATFSDKGKSAKNVIFDDLESSHSKRTEDTSRFEVEFFQIAQGWR